MSVAVRALRIGLIAAVVIAGAAFAVQILIAAMAPDFGPGSFARSRSPSRAIERAAWLFVVSFGVASGMSLLRELRLALSCRAGSP